MSVHNRIQLDTKDEYIF